jgi:hypothetical protein
MHNFLRGVKKIAPLQDFMDILGCKHPHFGSWKSRVVSNFFGSRFVGAHLVQIEPCLNHWKVLKIITIKCNQIPKANICNISQVTIWKTKNLIAKMSFDHVNDNLQHQHTNLTCDESITKFVWSSFIHRFVSFTHIYFALKTHLTQINVLMNEIHTYEWTNVTQILYLFINPCVKCVFNTWYKCAKCKIMNEQILHDFHY